MPALYSCLLVIRLKVNQESLVCHITLHWLLVLFGDLLLKPTYQSQHLTEVQCRTCNALINVSGEFYLNLQRCEDASVDSDRCKAFIVPGMNDGPYTL